MILRLPVLLFVLAALFFSQPAFAQRVDELPTKDIASVPTPAPTHEAPIEERIAAVVNDNIISTTDVKDRLALALLSSGLPDTYEVRQKLVPQVLRSLIDEQLQIQEGKRIDVTITPDEIVEGMKKLAAENNIPNGNMAAFLTAHGIATSTLESQIRSILTWNKVIQRELRPRVDVGDDEIDAEIDKLRANAGKQEYLVSEIYLAVDNPKDEESVKNFAESLINQIKNGGNFGAMARQFSQGTGAATGGDIGWVQSGQFPPELDKVLQSMQAGEIAGPVRSASGYHILGVRDKRTIAMGDLQKASMKLQQAFHPFADNQDKDDLLKEASTLRQSVNGCDNLQEKLAKDFPAWRWQDLGEVKMADAPSWLVDKTRDIAVGHASDAMATDKGALILFVCDRDMQENIDRNAILNTIGTERMELLARRLMRDLRRNAYIDVRLALVQ